jgi:hypothetical protein
MRRSKNINKIIYKAACFVTVFGLAYNGIIMFGVPIAFVVAMKAVR